LIGHSDEPPPGKTIDIFVGYENIRIVGFGGERMVGATWSRELVVWAPHKSLAEAKSLSTSYVPIPGCALQRNDGFLKGHFERSVSVEPGTGHYSRERTGCAAGCRVSKLLVYTPR
jgi:hypothetical protein